MFRKTDIPHLYPAATLLGYTSGPVVDTGCDLPAGGRVYIGEIEFRELCRHFDAVELRVYADTVSRLDVALAQLALVEQRLADVQHLIADAPSSVRNHFEAVGV